MRAATKADLYDALNKHQIDQAAQWAILRGDKRTLENLLKVRMNLVCMIAAPEGDIEEVTSQVRATRAAQSLCVA
jgi:hypothetical protein